MKKAALLSMVIIGAFCLMGFGPGEVAGDRHPADSYNTTMKEYREPMKMIDPSRMPYRVYKMFSGNNTLTYTRNSDSRTDSDKVTNAPEEEKSSLDGLRKKTWTLHQ